ncbi:MAG: tol-pal system YbgF family protein [Nitrospiria bacterium]
MKDASADRLGFLHRKLRFGMKIAAWGSMALAACLLTIWFVWSGDRWMSKQLFHQAEEKWQNEDYLGAVHDYERFVDAYPTSALVPEAHYWRGVALLLYLNDSEDAARAFQKAIRRDHASHAGSFGLKSRRYLAEIYEGALENPTEAIAVYEGIVEVSPDREEVFRSRYKIGELYYEIGDLPQARIEWDMLVKKDPQSHWAPAALYRMGGTHFVVGNCKEAVSVYKQLYTKYPEDKMSRFAKFRTANCLEMEKQHAAAYALYKELEKVYPDRALINRKIAFLKPRSKNN